MGKETRLVKYDAELNLEAYYFEGIVQKFPLHFHEYYVIGFIESGRRYLSCKNREYTVTPGDLLLFNPGDNHTCQQCDGQPMDYRSINIQREAMSSAVREITGEAYVPYFTEQVVFRSELVPLLRELHLMIMQDEKDFRKEELFYLLLEQLIEEYADRELPAPNIAPSAGIQGVCDFLQQHYMDNITLNDLSRLVGLSKYYLLRSFTKQEGISPYNYLITVRINKAKKLLEQGVSPVETALRTGFVDQSHFSNFFKKQIGLTPRQYMRIFSDAPDGMPVLKGTSSHA